MPRLALATFDRERGPFVTPRNKHPATELSSHKIDSVWRRCRIRETSRSGTGFFFGRTKMDDGFPPHVVGFMKRRREKEKDQKPSDEKS